MKAIEYFKGNKLASDVWKSKYALHDEEGNRLEDNPDQMHWRMAKEFARISKDYGWDNSLEGLSEYGKKRDQLDEDSIFCLFKDFKNIIPQGSIMYGLGNPYYITSLSNCVVLKDVVDSYGGIMYSDQQLAQLMKRRCGVGVDISKLRPKGSRTQNAARTSTGAVSFAKRFTNTTSEVAQEGRRGALMITLDCRHPDVLEFIKSKGDEQIVGDSVNISVKWHDDFMEAAKNGESYQLRWPVDGSVSEAEHAGHVVDPREVLKEAAMYAHGYDQKKGENSNEFGGDPGCMFIDHMIEYSTDCGYPNITVLSTNPCGEIGMHNDCCRLIALNFMSAVENAFTDDASIDYDRIKKLAYEQQVLLDNLVDLEIEKIDRILEKIDNDDEPDHIKDIERRTWKELKESAIKYRRTGGGFTALGDTLAALGYEYGSRKSLEIVDSIMRAKFRGEWNASIDLAIQRAPFLEWHPDFDNTGFFDMMKEEFPDIYERNMKYGRRNISLSTVAPTGSVSMLANINGEFGTTSGVEPVFSTEENVLWHTRRKKAQKNDEVTEVDENGIEWTEYKVFHEGFRQWLNANKGSKMPWKNSSKELLKKYAKKSPYVTSAELDYKDRVDLQAVVQKYTTHSISSTLNLPEDENWTTTKNIYEYAYDAGLKGVTIFRNGSKRGVLEGDRREATTIKYRDAPKRPEVLDADVYNVRDKWTVIVGLIDGKPYELFVINVVDDSNHNTAEIVKTGSKSYDLYLHTDNNTYEVENILQYSPSSDADVLTRFVSMLMRHEVKPELIVDQIEKADISISDFSTIVNSVLKQYIKSDKLTCDSCGSSNVAYVEGCAKCMECGNSKCG